jgi:hypothetical protein
MQPVCPRKGERLELATGPSLLACSGLRPDLEPSTELSRPSPTLQQIPSTSYFSRCFFYCLTPLGNEKTLSTFAFGGGDL